jgi:acetyl esterase/lipase
MLAEKSESSSVKFQFQMIPQVDDCFEKDEITPPFTEEELAYKGFMRGINAIHKENNSCSDYWIWPNLAPDSLIKKCPPALILTTEFDMFRRGSENAAKLFLRNDKLIEFGILKGTYHAHFYDFNCGRTAAWFEAIKGAIDVHLR